MNCRGSHSRGAEPAMGVLVQLVAGMLSGDGAWGKQDGAREGHAQQGVHCSLASLPPTEKPWNMSCLAKSVSVGTKGPVSDVSEVFPTGEGDSPGRVAPLAPEGLWALNSYRMGAVAEGTWVELHQHPQGAEPPEGMLNQIAGPHPQRF